MLSDQQVRAFEKDGAVTVDTPLTDSQIDDVSDLMDELLPLAPAEEGKEIRYRVGQNNRVEPAFVEVIQHPFFEEAAKRLLYADAVTILSTAIRKTHPQPTKVFEVGEHTDIIFSLADMASVPRRMDVWLFIWFSDVTAQTAPLMYRPGSHRQIAEHMGEKPVYVHGEFKAEDFENVPDPHSVPVGFAWHWPQLPQVDYAEPVPCVARRGQATAINQCAIHGASTNIGTWPRKSLAIGFRPKAVVVGDPKGRRESRREYAQKLRRVFAPDRRHLLDATG